MAKEISAEMVQQLEDAAAAWLEMAIRELIASAKKAKLELTGDTIASIAGSMASFSADGVGELLISFQNSGRFADWRKRFPYSKQPPIDALQKWVEEIGLSKFKSVPGYGRSKRPPTQSMAANRIAWGIAINRLRKGPGKRKGWFAKLFYKKLLAQLIQAQIQVLGTSSLQILEPLNEIG